MEHKIAGAIQIACSGQTLTQPEQELLQDQLETLIARVKMCANLSEAATPLDRLGEFQFELTVACFKWRVEMPPRLRAFIREFDRPDDSELRAAVFNAIHSNEFCAAKDITGRDQP